MRILCMDVLVSQKGYAGMSCSVCAGHSSYNCPCCGSGSVNWVECPDCEKGLTYHSISIRSGKEVKVTAVAYQILPFDEDDARHNRQNYYQGDIRCCKTCGGEGMIPEDY